MFIKITKEKRINFNNVDYYEPIERYHNDDGVEQSDPYFVILFWIKGIAHRSVEISPERIKRVLSLLDNKRNDFFNLHFFATYTPSGEKSYDLETGNSAELFED